MDRDELAPGLRRALARAESGKTLSVDEATTLAEARGAGLAELREAAGAVARRAHGERVTYSPKVFAPVTKLCRDACGYCTFAQPPRRDTAPYMTPAEVVAVAEAGAAAGCRELLLTLGDAPEERYPTAREWLEARGYASTLEYLRAVAVEALEATGLLPHLNPGLMSWQELGTLKQASASMGLMLETASARLRDRGMAHWHAPTKEPSRRLAVLEDAGRQSVPFTSGILIGIGETARERVEALVALRRLALAYGHLQEVIVQPFRAKPGTAMAGHREPGRDELLATVAVARLLLPSAVHVQAPPNLDPDGVEDLVASGVDDLGGISPVTVDHVNPEAPWPHLDRLAERLGRVDLELVPRLCVHPSWVRRPDPWIAGRMREPVARLADAEGLARGAEPEPVRWQDPPGGTACGDDARWLAARAGDGSGAAAAGRDGLLRADAADVYGDTALIAAETLGGGGGGVPLVSALDGPVRAGLRAAEAGRPPDERQAEALLRAEGAALEGLVEAADGVRRERVGATVTYVVNRNINFTNVCYTGCRFCAFAQRRDDPDAYTLSLEQVADRAEEAVRAGATEVCMQGGIHPDLGAEHYVDVIAAVRAREPGLHVHALSPMEIASGAARMGVPPAELLARARDAGLDTIPGTAAEILDDEVRWVLTKGKLPADAWEEIVTTAHRMGIRSSSTMMFGHVDQPRHWAAHLHRLRRIQERTGGFTEFVALPFVHQQAPIYLAGHARPGPTWRERVAVHATARLVLAGAIDHVQLSWVKVGEDEAVRLLDAGCDDLGGTLMEETISRMAGADHGVRRSPAELEAIAAAAGRPAAERTTTYELVSELKEAR